MKKRVLSMLFAVIMVVTLFTVSVSAAPAHVGAQTQVSNVCDKIAVSFLQAVVKAANREIDVYVKIAMMTPYDDVDRLLSRVDAVVARVMTVAEMLDLDSYSVECEYTYYQIDGRTVAIDPLKVVDLSDNVPETK
ncbi:MAG: hypothetical protein RRY76_05150 [Clostridia bacterium]